MKILRARHAGFCYGVRRATRMAHELLAKGSGPLFSLGPLMHNPQEVKRLSERGILPQERIEDCVGGKTLVRTHGISVEEIRRAKDLGVELVDATCPRVTASRRRIEAFGKQGRTVILVGERGHPEVRAILSHAQGRVVVVGEPSELPELPPDTPIGLVAQTTQSQEVFSSVVAAARERFSDTVKASTICEDAELRQDEGKRLAGQVDLMVVVGGRNSANTCRLAGICRAVQPRTFHVECAHELAAISLQGVGAVGLASGASTPDWIIAEVWAWLRRFSSKPGEPSSGALSEK